MTLKASMTELRVWTIPGYVLHERLDTSLVSATYLASRASDGYPVMLEVISEEFSDPESAELYRAALAQVAAVTHPVVPTIWEVGQSEGLLYAITNAVEGRSLATVLADAGPLTHTDALEVSTELADALDTLAAAGVVHGAVNPHSVWINDRRRAPAAAAVSLRGFGTMPLRSHRIRSQQDSPPPADVLYVAPEQVRGLAPTDLTDQYALACMTGHSLTGVPPFRRPTITALFDAHASEQFDGPGFGDQLSPRLHDAMTRALAKRQSDRFPSCIGFAAAIGGTEQHSWEWNLDPAESTAAGPSDDTAAAATAGTSERGTAAPAGATGTAAPADRTRSRWLTIGMVAALVVFAVVAVVAAISVLGGGSDDAVATDGSADAQIPTIDATWRATAVDGGLAALATADDEIIAAGDGVVRSVDHETGELRWEGEIDGAATALSILGPSAIVRTTDETIVGVDRLDGAVLWTSSETDLTAVDAVTGGRGRLFGVGPSEDGSMVVNAIDPATGEVAWSLTPGEGGAAADDPAPLLTFDGSEEGGRTLYATWGDELHAFDVTSRQPRWTVSLSGGAPTSMTAHAGALLVVDSDGTLCRYDADGTTAWDSCPALEGDDGPGTIVQSDSDQVIVGSGNEVMAVDVASGTTQWRVQAAEQLQPVLAGVPQAAFVVRPDGAVEALDHDDGASYWQSEPLGDVSAMTATDGAVFVSTADGVLVRLEAGALDEG